MNGGAFLESDGEDLDLQKSQIWTKIAYCLLVFGVFSAPTARKNRIFRLRRSRPLFSVIFELTI